MSKANAMYAIYYGKSSMVARTPAGAYHIYNSKTIAERAAAKMGGELEVRPYGPQDEDDEDDED